MDDCQKYFMLALDLYISVDWDVWDPGILYF